MGANIYIYAVVSMGILGALFAAGLTIASRIFAVKVDPNVEKVLAVLPGANCGACGQPGCQNYAEAVVAGQVPTNGCPPGGANVANQIAEILGVEGQNTGERQIAHVFCNGTKENATSRSLYEGIATCAASQALGGGHKGCTFGCLSLGDCVQACPFGAAVMGEDGLPRFDPERCTGCGKCVEACPRNLVRLVGISKRNHIRCSAPLSAKEIRQVCRVGCIGCSRCVKACPNDAISISNRLAVIDYEKCQHAGACAEVCPMNTIQFIQAEEGVKT